MPEYSSDDAAYATRIVERLINREAEGLDLERDLVVSDVESDANTFSDELLLLEEYNANMPALLIAGETVPVSLNFAINRSERSPLWPPFGLSQSRPWRHHPFWREAMYELLQPLRDKQYQFDGFSSMNREEARSTFMRRAADFVATRIAGVRGFRHTEPGQTWRPPSLLTLRQRLRGPQVATPGCLFTIFTNSTGLRVLWSGAYYVTPNNFNHPTSPTSSVLQSGTYIFGVDGGAYGNNVQWDLNGVVSLPGLPYAHLNF